MRTPSRPYKSDTTIPLSGLWSKVPRLEVKRMRPLVHLLWIPIVLAVAACQYPDAYIYAPREFDRSAPEFRQVPLERTSVTVCASPFRASNESIATLADNECQQYGKRASEPTVGFGACPMLLASAVVFRCVPLAL